jgi:DNA-3-methyladenine glycosylase
LPSTRSRTLRRELLAADTLDAARSLLGALLVRESGPERRVGRIVEVEAYIGVEDLASHARFGLTKRNAVMFGPPGVAYVYLVYGMHNCLNVVTEAAGRPAALLVRAVEPVEGIGAMREARGGRAAAIADQRLASGPGLVCAAFSIDRRSDGLDLCDQASDLRLEARPGNHGPDIVTSPRIGIGYAPEPWLSRPWRLFVAGSASLSKARV